MWNKLMGTRSRRLVAVLLLCAVFFGSMLAGSLSAQPVEAKEDNDLSLYNIASAYGTLLNRVWAGKVKDTRGISLPGHGKGGLAGAYLGYTDTDLLTESAGSSWLASVMARNSRTYSYALFSLKNKTTTTDAIGTAFGEVGDALGEALGETLGETDGGTTGDASAAHDSDLDDIKSSVRGFYEYCYLGYTLRVAGLDKTGSAGGLNLVNKLVSGITRLLMTGCDAVPNAFNIILRFLQFVNPFQFLIPEVVMSSKAGGSSVIFGWVVIEEGNALYNAAKLYSDLYVSFLNFSLAVIFPLMIAFTLFAVFALRPASQGGQWGKFFTIFKRMLAIFVIIPICGSLYTLTLSKIGNMTASSDSRVGATLVMKNFIDFEGWAKRGLPCDEGRVAIHKVILGNDSDELSSAMANNLSDAVYELNERSSGLYTGDNNVDYSAYVRSLLDRYGGGERFDGSAYESYLKSDWLSHMSDDFSSEIEKVSSAKTVEKIMLEEEKIFGEKGRRGLIFKDERKSGEAFYHLTGSDLGEPLYLHSSGKYLGQLSPLSTYNYLNTVFDSDSLTVYSPNQSMSWHSRPQHYSVNLVGTGITAVLNLFSMWSIMCVIMVIGWGYALGLFFCNFKRSVRILMDLPFAAVGFTVYAAKIIASIIVMILEICFTFILYDIVTKFYMAIPELFHKIAEDRISGDQSAIAVPFLLLIIGILFMIRSLKLRKEVVAGIDEAIDGLVNRVFQTNVSSADRPGLGSKLATGLAAGAGMAIGNHIVNRKAAKSDDNKRDGTDGTQSGSSEGHDPDDDGSGKPGDKADGDGKDGKDGKSGSSDDKKSGDGKSDGDGKDGTDGEGNGPGTGEENPDLDGNSDADQEAADGEEAAEHASLKDAAEADEDSDDDLDDGGDDGPDSNSDSDLAGAEAYSRKTGAKEALARAAYAKARLSGDKGKAAEAKKALKKAKDKHQHAKAEVKAREAIRSAKSDLEKAEANGDAAGAAEARARMAAAQQSLKGEVAQNKAQRRVDNARKALKKAEKGGNTTAIRDARNELAQARSEYSQAKADNTPNAGSRVVGEDDQAAKTSAKTYAEQSDAALAAAQDRLADAEASGNPVAIAAAQQAVSQASERSQSAHAEVKARSQIASAKRQLQRAQKHNNVAKQHAASQKLAAARSNLAKTQAVNAGYRAVDNAQSQINAAQRSGNASSMASAQQAMSRAQSSLAGAKARAQGSAPSGGTKSRSTGGGGGYAPTPEVRTTVQERSHTTGLPSGGSVPQYVDAPAQTGSQPRQVIDEVVTVDTEYVYENGGGSSASRVASSGQPQRGGQTTTHTKQETVVMERVIQKTNGGGQASRQAPAKQSGSSGGQQVQHTRQETVVNERVEVVQDSMDRYYKETVDTAPVVTEYDADLVPPPESPKPKRRSRQKGLGEKTSDIL